MRIIKANKKGIGLAVKYLRQGKAVVYPTDTAYGLGVDATNPTAVKRLIKIKNRPNQPIHVIVNNFSAAKKLAMFDKMAEKIFKKLLPGQLTLVLPTLPPPTSPFPKGRGRKGKGFLPHAKGSLRSREGEARERQEGVDYINLLSAGTGTIGIRIPDNRIALELARRLKKPITTPSANPHGGRTPYSIAGVIKQFQGKKYQPDLYLDAGKLPKIRPSTIVRINLPAEEAGDGTIKILRQGPISKKQIIRELITGN